ncbi:bifunctional ADP-dependent NAD(P)H-hydrate dehydratase/NAD(P)H-hydrate epimerase [Brachybacterium hainanense]|uniref:ADP-dependent (S)-NAD(P)H-hydrate dehydratase n=1 Tax=Brachybacterium hainanense TaxID=1541174 RepID=A0ABV6RA64_9MICO
MLPVLSADAVRRAEQAHVAAHPGADLMGRAAGVLAEHITLMLGGAHEPLILVVAGPGANAGDALHAVSLLPRTLRACVRVRLVRGRTHEPGLAACRAAGGMVIGAQQTQDLLPRADLVVDAVAGLGSRPLAGEAAELARAARTHRRRVLSVDLPSGLRADSAVQDGACFAAERTVALVAPKLCHVAAPAALACGQVHLARLGVDPGAGAVQQVQDTDLRAWYPFPDARSHKYTRGVLGLETGSRRYPGAAVLGAAGALHAGVGMIRHPGEAGTAVLARFPSVVPAAGRVQASVCGSGWDLSDPGARLAHERRLAQLLEDALPLVVDAGALDLLPGRPALPDGSLLTPHAGELARLLGRDRADVEADPLGSAREAAARTGASVLLKGATQLVADPDGQVLLAVPGPAWTAQAGSGDVLAGACGALLAAGLPPARAGILAASLQAITASRHPGPLPPERLAAAFPEVLADWEAQLIGAGERPPRAAERILLTDEAEEHGGGRRR